MLRRVALALAALAALAGAPAAPLAAQTVCRPDALGSERCLRPQEAPPKPRPPIRRGRTDGMRPVLERNQTDPSGPTVIPAWRRNRLGTTLPGGSDTGTEGSCQTDSLGNLICR